MPGYFRPGHKSKPEPRNTRRSGRGPQRRSKPVDLSSLAISMESLEGDAPEMAVNPAEMTLAAIRRAGANQRTLILNYSDSAGNASEDREVEPYELRMRGGRMWLYAFCLNRKATRMFDVAKIDQPREGQPFEPKWPVRIVDEEEEPGTSDQPR